MTPLSGGMLHEPIHLWWLLGQALTWAETHFGPRDPAWTPLGVNVGAFKAPYISFPATGERHVLVNLPDTVGSLGQAGYQLAHEALHLLNPVREASFLEEGLAVWCAQDYCARFAPDYDPGPPTEGYAQAFELVQPLLADLAPLRAWRAAHPGLGFSDITAAALVRLYPFLPDHAADALTARFAVPAQENP